MTDLILMKSLFWTSFAAVVYAYFGYPLALMVLKRLAGPKKARVTDDSFYEPALSIIIPVHNEAAVIEEKLRNLMQLDYPAGKCEIIIISDGSTDRTGEIVSQHLEGRIKYIEMPERRGKAAALNAGVEQAANEIIVFSDASIMIEQAALRNIVRRFRDPEIGCISGEDHIREPGGEGFYGKYELWLRNLESRVHSIVGASGSFYAQRRELCQPFEEGMAPDFFSVLNTVEKGFLAINEPLAFGTMKSLKDTKDEFNRKVRTLVRGMTVLFHKKGLLNPYKYGFFAIELFSHKIMRWLVPFFLILLFISNLVLFQIDFYYLIFICQIFFYLLALISFSKIGNFYKRIWGKIPLYFTTVNAAILFAWFKYLSGVRQEIWNPTKRQA